MLDLNTNIGKFMTIKDLLLEMKYNNIYKVDIEIRYCLRTVRNKCEMTYKQVEDFIKWDNSLFWENEFISRRN